MVDQSTAVRVLEEIVMSSQAQITALSRRLIIELSSLNMC